jgi:hypothetical protein
MQKLYILCETFHAMSVLPQLLIAARLLGASQLLQIWFRPINCRRDKGRTATRGFLLSDEAYSQQWGPASRARALT